MLEQFRRSFLSSSIFVNRAHVAVGRLTGDTYWTRKGEAKELIEEVLPIAALLKHLCIPGREVKCRLAQPYLNHDAELRFAGRDVTRGSHEARYFVEVTSAASKVNHLYRESLATHGYVFGGQKITSTGSKRLGNRSVKSEACAIDHAEMVLDVIRWIRECITAKSTKSYPSPCFLIINLETDRPFDISEWATVIESIADCPDRTKFKRVYLVRWLDSSVFAV